MRAVRFESYGGTDVLDVVDVETPEVGEGTVLLKVKACSINPFDSKVREGLMEGMVPVTFPSAQGSDVAGVIEAVGDGVDGWAVGDEVLGATAVRGSQAEYALGDPGRLVRKPQALGWETAGAINVVGATAWAMVAAVDVAGADTVLVSGASGGVGSLACQLAVKRGAKVIGVASAPNHEWLQSLGVTPVPYGEGLEQAVTAIAGSDGVSAVLARTDRHDRRPRRRSGPRGCENGWQRRRADARRAPGARGRDRRRGARAASRHGAGARSGPRRLRPARAGAPAGQGRARSVS
jgi:NADPH:quinone reductase-like Zn-dependent oxidoreductase